MKSVLYIQYKLVKTIRIITEQLHKELLKIQGEIQAQTGESTNMDDVINELLKHYRKKTNRF